MQGQGVERTQTNCEEQAVFNPKAYAVVEGPRNRLIRSATVYQPQAAKKPADNLTRDEAEMAFTQAIKDRRADVDLRSGRARIAVIAR